MANKKTNKPQVKVRKHRYGITDERLMADSISYMSVDTTLREQLWQLEFSLEELVQVTTALYRGVIND